VLHYAPRHEDVLGSGSIAPPFLTWALDRESGQLGPPVALLAGTDPSVFSVQGPPLSEFLAIDPEVPGSIPCATRFSEK
jgi:hypothetical protein